MRARGGRAILARGCGATGCRRRGERPHHGEPIMRNRQVRTIVLLGLVATAGMIFAGSGLACASMAFSQAATTGSFCFLFDCQNGAYGGLFQFCRYTADGSLDVERSLLADCPEQIATTP